MIKSLILHKNGLFAESDTELDEFSVFISKDIGNLVFKRFIDSSGNPSPDTFQVHKINRDNKSNLISFSKQVLFSRKEAIKAQENINSYIEFLEKN